LKYAYDKGHQIGSHTWAHEDLTTLNWDQIHDQMWRTELAVIRITGAYPAFMRPPYGAYNSLVLQASYIRGQSLVLWDTDTGDSEGASVASQKSVIDGIVKRHPSKALVLQHETYQPTVDQVLPYALTKLKAAGYQLVTVAECLGKAPYQSVKAPLVRDSTWHC
jgi:peptidoglycan/xylan/chitin deacetylase (PgdA/CDA1 family)